MRSNARPEAADPRDGDAVSAVHQRPAVKYLASEQITVTHKKSLGIERNTEIRRQPIPVEYNPARTAYLECEKRPDGIYIPCGGWGSIHSVDLLERDLDTRW